MLTLRQLRYFEALAEQCHFGRAAQQCNVSQPALSMQIAELEKDLGITLVERGPRGVSLTDAGAEIARRARQILSSVADLADYGQHRGRVLVGDLRLGVIPSIGPYLLPSVLPALKQKFPELRLSLRETQTQHLIAELLDGQIDVTLLALPIEERGIEEMVLFEDPFQLALHKGHRLASEKCVTQGSLNSERLLLLEEGHCLRDQTIAFCKNSGLGDYDEFGASSLATIVQMVANGYGITLLPRMSLPVEVRDDETIRVLPFEPPVPERTVGLAWRRTSPRKADFVELGRLIIEIMAPDGTSERGPDQVRQ